MSRKKKAKIEKFDLPLRPTDRPPRLVYLSAVLTLIALALMLWSILAPTPLPVMLAMTVGQGIGTIAFGLYALVVLKDLRAEWRMTKAKATELEHEHEHDHDHHEAPAPEPRVEVAPAAETPTVIVEEAGK